MDAFQRLLGFAALLLLLVLAASCVMPPPWSWGVGLVYIAYDTWLLSSMVWASRRALSQRRAAVPSDRRLSLAVLVAARDESTVLPTAIEAVLSQNDPPDRILVIDDGSTDGTRSLMEQRYVVRFDGPHGTSATHRTLHVLSKSHSGKARSLNEALSTIQEDIFVTLDADTFLEPGAIAALRRAFEANTGLGVACGVLRPVCASGVQGRVFELYQQFEYLRGFLWRLAWSSRNTLVLVSGAFAAFRRERVESIGGYDPTSLVEDYELMFRLHRSTSDADRPFEAVVISEARATTDAPATLRLFLRQRTRWFAGFLQTLFRHHDMVGARKYGPLGRLHLRVKTIDMLLPVYGLSAAVVLIGLLIAGHQPGRIVLVAIVFKLLFDLSCHFYSMLLYQRWMKEPVTLRFSARALLATLTEPIGFQLVRQLGAVLGWVAFLRGRIEWHPQRVIAVNPRAS